MKKFLHSILVLGFTLLAFSPVKAQVNDVGELLRGGLSDSNLLLENYLKPYANGFGADLNTGWNNSARPYRTLGFDVKVSAALAFVPTRDKSFDVAALQFQELELFSSSGITPTIAGDNVTGAQLGKMYENPITQQQEELFSFNLPKGTGFPLVPAPMIQGTVGLISDTDVSLRVVPSISAANVDGQVSLYGFGVRHGLNQWIPGGTTLPIDLSVQVGYTRFNFDIETNVQPESGTDIRNDFDASEWDGQQFELQTSGFTGNLLVGRNLPIISVFAGVGFQSSTTDIITKGSYPVTVPNEQFDPASSPQPKAIDRIVDPFNLSISGDNSIHALAGFRVRLGFIALSGSYTISEYPVANVGIGISMR